MGWSEISGLSPRKLLVLTAIVESYVATGEPVASQVIARAGAGDIAGLSSATIRNIMVDLAEMGLLEQPHTSSGRIPTAQGFRVYVERLKGANRSNTLTESSRVEIERSLQGASNTQSFLERTSQVLSSISSGVGVALASVHVSDQLEHIYFSRLGANRVMAVVVTRPGVVRDRMLTLEREVPVGELETAANFLNENFRGWTIDSIRVELGRRLEQERNAYQQLLTRVEQLWRQALPEGEITRQIVYVDGVANLVDSYSDHDRIRAMLQALEAKQRLIELLNAYVDAQQRNVRVVFDLEDKAPGMEGLVLIAAPARVGGETRGALAVIGPQRMQYEQTMSAVSYVAQLFDRMLQPGEESGR